MLCYHVYREIRRANLAVAKRIEFYTTRHCERSAAIPDKQIRSVSRGLQRYRSQ